MATIIKLGRRDFIKLGSVAGTGLLLGVRLPERRSDGEEGKRARRRSSPTPFSRSTRTAT